MPFNLRRASLLSAACITAVAVTVAVDAGSLRPVHAQPGQAAAKGSKAKKPPQKSKQIPGGANQVTGLNGKVGQVLWDGRWRFQVQEVQMVDKYTLKVPSSQQDYGRFHNVASEDLATHTYTPLPGYTFVAVKCLAKNGQKTVQQLDCYPPDLHAALTDNQGVSYPPIVYDMQSEGAWTSKKLLPGSAQPLTILFAVPPGTKLQDLVFTLKNWADNKRTDLRISLPQPTTAPAPAANAPAPTTP
jgi:hypothetical protein